MSSLMILSHPTYTESIANKMIVETMKMRYDTLSVRHIDVLYNPLSIDSTAEQEALVKADTLILQFPLFWYTVPSMLKYWLDSVLTYQFAFGSQGDKLQGKSFIVSVTVGAQELSYTADGKNGIEIEGYFTWLRQLSIMTQMHYKGVIASYGYGPHASPDHIESATTQHVDQLCALMARK